MFEKANCLQDRKNRTTPPGSPFLGRTSFYVFKIDFRCIAVRKFKAKKCSKKQTAYRILKIELLFLVVPFFKTLRIWRLRAQNHKNPKNPKNRTTGFLLNRRGTDDSD